MKFIKSIDELEKIYGLPSVASLRKVMVFQKVLSQIQTPSVNSLS